MKLEDQVTSLGLSKRIKELGVMQGQAIFLWYMHESGNVTLEKYPKHPFEPRYKERTFDAFTVAELGAMLPIRFSIEKSDEGWFVTQPDDDIYKKYAYESTEADARAKMLIYLLENKLLELETTK